MRQAHSATALDELQAASQAVIDAIGRFDAAGRAARAVGAGWRDIGTAAGFAPNTVWHWWSGRGSAKRPVRLAVDTFRAPAPSRVPDEIAELYSPALRRLRERLAAGG
jgi:hypothetical protein